MTLYFSEKSFTDEVVAYLKKEFPRGELNSNYLKIRRAGTIDEHLFLRYFDCAVAKEHNLYKAIINLPADLENRIPSWFVRTDGEIWVDPQSGPKGKNIYGKDVFTVKFQLYLDEDKVHQHVETQNISVEEALIGEFIEIKHALIDGNNEPIEALRSFYSGRGIKTPQSQVATYLVSILTVPH